MPAKKARKSRTVITFGVGLTASAVSIVLHYLELVALPPEAVAAAVTTVVTSFVGLFLRLKTSTPIERKAKPAPPPASHTFLVVLPFLFIGCAAIGPASEKAGWCIAKCSASCAATWVGDLISGAKGTELAAVDFARDTEIRDGSRLYLPVEGPDGEPVAYAGRLQGAPMVSGKIRAGYFLDDEGGPARLVLLSPEPRMYCASLALLEGALAASPGYAPADPPASRADFVKRFGALPVFP